MSAVGAVTWTDRRSDGKSRKFFSRPGSGASSWIRLAPRGEFPSSPNHSFPSVIILIRLLCNGVLCLSQFWSILTAMVVVKLPWNSNFLFWLHVNNLSITVLHLCVQVSKPRIWRGVVTFVGTELWKLTCVPRSFPPRSSSSPSVWEDGAWLVWFTQIRLW